MGLDDKSIATVDADGVALAAIQGLNQKLEARGQNAEDQIRKLQAENAALRTEIETIKELLQRLQSFTRAAD